MRSRVLLSLVLGLSLLVGLPGLAGCTTNPATGRTQFNLLSMDREIALGAEATPELLEAYGGEVEDERLRAFMRRVGESMTPHTEGEFPDIPWEFFLLDSDVINAFALPGGKVFMSRGLAEQFTDEAQFAAVVGHEIGHVTARHGNERVSRALLAQGIAIGAAIGAGRSDDDVVRYGVPILVQVGAGGYMLSFNRSQETEADRLGMRYMTAAGYDPSALLDVMEVLAAAAGGPRQPEFLSTHPHPETRIEQANELLASEYAHTRNNPEYQRHRARYRSEFLDRLPRRQTRDDGDGQDGADRFALHNPATWCLHCAAAAEKNSEE